MNTSLMADHCELLSHGMLNKEFLQFLPYIWSFLEKNSQRPNEKYYQIGKGFGKKWRKALSNKASLIFQNAMALFQNINSWYWLYFHKINIKIWN